MYDLHRAPKQEWRYVPNAHEPIISQELFDKVQQMFADRAEMFKQKMDENAPLRESVTNHLKGKIYCGDCGKRMRFVKLQIKDIQLIRIMLLMYAMDIWTAVMQDAPDIQYVTRQWQMLCLQQLRLR